MMVPAENHDADNTGDERCADDTRHEYFTALLSRHHTALMSYILSLVPNWPDAEDLLQQTSVVMWRRFGEFERGTNFLGWACQIAHFHAMNHFRRQSRDRHIFSLELIETMAREGAAEAEELDAQRSALQSCIEKLEPHSRNLLGRCYQVGVSLKDVAASLGRTPTSIYKGLNRIRETLLRCVRRSLAEEGAP